MTRHDRTWLRGPRRVRVRGDPQDVHVAAADLHHEQAVQALEGHRAVHVKEVDGKHRRGLRVEELPPARIGAPHAAVFVGAHRRAEAVLVSVEQYEAL